MNHLHCFHNCSIVCCQLISFYFFVVGYSTFACLAYFYWVWYEFENIPVFTTYLCYTMGGTFFTPSFLNDSNHDLFNASWRISLSFDPMIIWSLRAVSSAVHWGDSQLKLQSLASKATWLSNVINISFSFCKFDRNWKCFSVIFSVGLWYCHNCYKLIPLCTFSCFFCRYCHAPV